MTGGTCPINYQGVVSVEKGSAIILYKLAELIKKLRRGTLLSRSHVSSMTMVGRTLLSPSRVSNMTGDTCPTNYQGVVSVEKGSVIILYKLVELIKKLSRGTPLSFSHISSMTRRESNLALPQPCFKHERRILSDILPRSC